MLEDHDLLAERTLAALGSDAPLCVQILDAWRNIRQTEQLCDLLVREDPLSREELGLLGSQHETQVNDLRTKLQRPFPSFRRRLPPHHERRWRQGVERHLAFIERLWDLTLLGTLPMDMRRVLALSALVNAARRRHLEGFRWDRTHQVEAALVDLALPPLRQSVWDWRRNLREYSLVDLELWLRAPREEPTCAAWIDGDGAHGALSLPLNWFTEVWARGIAIVDGCFVLDVRRRRTDQRLDVTALRWERQRRGLSQAIEVPALVVRGRYGDWRLAWPGWP